MEHVGNERDKWLKVTREQARELELLRKMTAKALQYLRGQMEKAGEEKSIHIPDLLKLSQLQMKLIAIEQDLRREIAGMERPALKQSQPLNTEDWALLEAAIARRKTEDGQKE